MTTHRVARVDVDVSLEVLQNFLQITGSRRAEKAGVAISLKVQGERGCKYGEIRIQIQLCNTQLHIRILHQDTCGVYDRICDTHLDTTQTTCNTHHNTQDMPMAYNTQYSIRITLLS